MPLWTSESQGQEFEKKSAEYFCFDMNYKQGRPYNPETASRSELIYMRCPTDTLQIDSFANNHVY